jgi:hemerythrin
MDQYQIPILTPEQMPLVELEEMNQVHREEIEMINRLGALVLNGLNEKPAIKEITQCIAELIDHTREHFEGENKMMEAYGFPPYAVHKGEHDQVLARLDLLRDQWGQDHELAGLAEFVFTEWRDWFDAHVKSMDSVTAQFLSRFIR